MVLPPIYSRRKRQAEVSGPDVYNYDAIPHHVRVQVVQMLESGLGAMRSSIYGVDALNPCYEHVVKAMRRENGVTALSIPLRAVRITSYLPGWKEKRK